MLLVKPSNIQYFFGNDDNGQPTLWKTDGSQAGTVALASGLLPQSLPVSYNGQHYLYMSDFSNSSGSGLWRINPANDALELEIGRAHV